MVQNQYNTKIKILCTNNNIGYFNTILEGICQNKESFTKTHVQVPLNKMELLRRKIDIYQKIWFDLSCLLLMHQNICGEAQFLLLVMFVCRIFGHTKVIFFYSPNKRKYYVTMNVTFFENQHYFPKNSLQGENGSKKNFWDLFQITTSTITTPTPFPVSEPEPELNETPINQTNTLEQTSLNSLITQPISLENLPTISLN